MLARVLRLPFTCGFVLTLLVSVVLLLLLAPSTGWAQGPVNSDAVPPGQGDWIPLTGGDEPHNRAPIVPSQVTSRPIEERSVGMVPPAASTDSNQAVNGSQGASTESVGEDLHRVLAPNAPGVYMSPLVIPAADFRNNGPATGGYFFSFEGGGYVRSTGGIVCMMAPAYLPQNATVYQMWATFYDNGGATRPWVNLYRVNNFDATLASQGMGTLLTTSTSASLQNLVQTSISYPVVIFPDYSYYLGGCLYDSQQRIYSTRLYYTGP
jgi:hypothetical protein